MKGSKSDDNSERLGFKADYEIDNSTLSVN